MIILTIDTDWANDEITLKVLKKIDSLGVKCSVFLTDGLAHNEKWKNIEIGVHPELLNVNINETLKEYNKNFKSNLIRTHRFFWYSDLAKMMVEKGFLYDSSLILPYQKNIGIFKAGRLWRFPVWASDHLHLMRKYSFKDFKEMPNWQESKLKIFCFHIAYLYLNQYDISKFNMINDSGISKNKINKNKFGVWNLFEGLAEEIYKENKNYFFSELLQDTGYIK